MVSHGGNIEEAIEKYGLKNKTLIDFSANINPLGVSSAVKKAIYNNIGIIVDYPDTECRNIKKSLSAYLEVPQDNLLVGNGSVELIFLIVLALKLKRVLIPVPAFGEYERAVGLYGGKSNFVDIHNASPRIRMSKIKKHFNRIDALFICNPNNPSGFLFEQEELRFLIDECDKRRILLIIDEAFMDFVKNNDKLTAVKLACKKNNLLVLRSLTKFFALPGLRIGYLAANENLIEKISYFRQPWSVNSLAQLVGAQVIKDGAFIKKSRSYMFIERKRLFDALSKIEYLVPYPPAANFIFCEISKSKINSHKLCDYCGKKGLLLRDCSDLRGLDGRFIRIAVRRADENNKLIKVLQEFL